jgi:hypothetical protein
MAQAAPSARCRRSDVSATAPRFHASDSSPVPNTNFGIEYTHGRREEDSRDKATLNRFQLSA